MSKIVIVSIVILLIIGAGLGYYFYSGPASTGTENKIVESSVDTSQCDAIDVDSRKLTCYNELSVDNNDVSLCDNLIKWKESCYINFAQKVDWGICESPILKSYITAEGGYGPDFCYLTIVSRGNNLLGKSLTDEEIVSLCEKIQDNQLGGDCLAYVGDPFNIPQEIKDKYPGRYD